MVTTGDAYEEDTYTLEDEVIVKIIKVEFRFVTADNLGLTWKYSERTGRTFTVT
jgi:hypothetical protein